MSEALILGFKVAGWAGGGLRKRKAKFVTNLLCFMSFSNFNKLVVKFQ